MTIREYTAEIIKMLKKLKRIEHFKIIYTTTKVLLEKEQ